MRKQTSFALAIGILWAAAALRLIGLAGTPPGLSVPEATDAQIAELVRVGVVEVLYDVNGIGREGLYHIVVSALTTFIGDTSFGYRMISVWAGVLALAVTFTLARRLYGRTIGLISMAAMALPLWSVLLSRTIARETLMPLIVIGVLTSLARALPVYRRPNLNPHTAPFAVLGLLLGLGFYVHPAHYLLVLVVMVFIVYMLVSHQPMSRRTLSYLSFTIVVLVIVATPYLISSLRLQSLSGAERLGTVLATVQDSGGLLRTIGSGLLGFFLRGDANILHNVPNRPYTDVLSGFFILAGMLYSGQRWQQPRYALPLVAFVVLLPVALIAPGAPNFMGYSVMIPLLALFFGLGVKFLQRRFPSPVHIRWTMRITLLLLAVNLLWTGYSLYVVWGPDPAVANAYHQRTWEIARYLDGTVSGTDTVVCVPVVPTEPVWLNPATDPAALLALMMDNPDEAQVRYVDCGSGLIFTDGGEHQQVILLEAGALERIHPHVRAWLAQGDLITEGVPTESVISMVVDDTLGDRIGLFTTTAPTGYAPESPGGVDSALLPVNFDRNLSFLGYDEADTGTYQPGDIVTVITYWRTDGPLPPDLSLFTHILFDAETIVTQTDTISVQPARLKPRDVFVQVTFVTLPDGLPTGTYQTSIGAYEVQGEGRLQVIREGQPRGNRLFLSEITVQDAQPVVNNE